MLGVVVMDMIDRRVVFWRDRSGGM
jgi:hypothetical protein